MGKKMLGRAMVFILAKKIPETQVKVIAGNKQIM